jgi:hypothetical protein
MIGRWASQQESEQKTEPVRLWLQVETLQIQYFERKAIAFLQLEHFLQTVGERFSIQLQSQTLAAESRVIALR